MRNPGKVLFEDFPRTTPILDGIIFDYAVADNQSDLYTKNHVRHNVTIVYKGIGYSATYQCPKNTVIDKYDVIDCILSDTNAYDECYDISEFQREFGYENVEKCINAYKACKKASKKIHKMFTNEELEQLNKELASEME